MSELLNALDGIEDPSSSGGSSGFYCRAKISFGYKVFATGVQPQDSLFEFDPYNKKSAELALDKARAFVKEHNVTKSPSKSIVLTLHRETVKGREVNWAGDQQKVVARWMKAYDDIWLPALEKLGIKKPGDYWMHVALVDDPSGRTSTYTGRDGVERTSPEKVWVPDAIYPNEAICEKAAGDDSSGSTSSEPAPPEGFTAELWAQYKPDIVKELGSSPSDDDYDKVSSTWGVPVEYLKSM